MPIHNSDIADIFREVADLLSIEGANEFRVRSYRQAAQKIDNLTQDIAEMVEEGEDLTGLSGIGDSIAEKIEEIVETGSLDQLEEIKESTPEALEELLDLAGLGPERVSDLYKELGIESGEDLKAAAESQQIREIEGFGKKTEQKILDELEKEDKQKSRYMISRAEEYTEPLRKYIESHEDVIDVEVAGSYRRCKETVGDIDILATCENRENVMDYFVTYDNVDTVESKGDTKSTVYLRSGLQFDLRLVDKQSYGAAILYFTGSAQHNIALRDRALDRNLKINEYGVFPEDDDEPVAGETEKEVYNAVDLPFIQPELRENQGEIEAAESGNLPDLITQEDLKGDLQMHTTATDGAASIEEMAHAARDMGYEYIAITDHSKRVTVAQGLNADELAEHIEKIDEVNDSMDDFRILKSCEVDILEDGSLDLSDNILKELDMVLCCIHYHRDLSQKQQTERYIKAIEHPLCNVIGHPTGREIHKRGEMNLDMEKIMDAAESNNVFLELNATPRRLDLNDIYCKMAKERGIKLTISTDSHSTEELNHIRFGINQARRGWLQADDVINTRSVTDVLDMMKK
ncbi:MAG: DNA polymerase/3'-5' exonuclease PolX [Candidatus Marinimicrobia bacterium]|nr:DNA polymerase/3'-5' exonuclease PolX [Candidatus Neomarinimicrobiota bacterium]